MDFDFFSALSLNTTSRPHGHSKQVCAVALKEAGKE